MVDVAVFLHEPHSSQLKPKELVIKDDVERIVFKNKQPRSVLLEIIVGKSRNSGSGVRYFASFEGQYMRIAEVEGWREEPPPPPVKPEPEPPEPEQQEIPWYNE